MRRIPLALVVLLAFGAGSPGWAASGLKPGLWETRTTKMVVDGKDVTKQMEVAAQERQKALAAMPAAQRKRFTEATGQPTEGDPMARRICVSAAMAASDQTMVPRPARAECQSPTLRRNGNRTGFDMACKGADGGAMTGKGETVVEGDHVRTTIQTDTTARDGARHTMAAETQMRFLGADCAGLKPLDQLLKSARQVGAGTAGVR